MTLLSPDPEQDDLQSEDSRYGDMTWISGGTFRMGSDRHYPEEAPVHRVTVDCLPIMNGWSHTARLYRPRPEILSGIEIPGAAAGQLKRIVVSGYDMTTRGWSIVDMKGHWNRIFPGEAGINDPDFRSELISGFTRGDLPGTVAGAAAFLARGAAVLDVPLIPVHMSGSRHLAEPLGALPCH